ncbi:hypothetical protein CaCOL14_008949 [Colletotrichum acutatum]|uniref:Uncharacterized protein n=4 Tax=Colletotrichum acutatum species complex TaxID=2707335 RepID=A0AAJ0F089_9PEZI|nr:uncharacterized protein BDZ83DRAFT_746170 [Colletotrichum acutatum]XP_060387823.1 uncharacterized protein CTAM01_01320 [Colletotrichum tamarilloi]XP_060434096.1 uncharacterized protein BDP55DRAFT_724949 [Colletotrichum godetiae]XP_060440990.1 uncharacterized protein BDP81DRAFT_398190 [Colletotrichum phormii]KAI3532748.1 hypothetical protein CSPX01_13208 [Colletotrichum filicis]KAK1510747.1 hypothetical protein CTAM01_01320 [Colletotrichum tamarilloi]KAK1624995.1 hypothetical protein BDP81D
MQFPAVFSMVLAIASLGAFVQARPSPCPDWKRDDILNGKASPEICCSYGVCKGDVVVMSG